MSLDTLREALRARHMDVELEARGRIVILSARDADTYANCAHAEARAQLVRLAAEHGFSNTALELSPHA